MNLKIQILNKVDEPEYTEIIESINLLDIGAIIGGFIFGAVFAHPHNRVKLLIQMVENESKPNG